MSKAAKLSEFEIAMLVMQMEVSLFKVEQISELLHKAGYPNTDEINSNEEVQENRITLPCSENLKNLPWKSYKTKQTAAQNEEAWIFADTKGAEALLAKLKTKEKVQIDGFNYQSSGKEMKFISRKPLKP